MQSTGQTQLRSENPAHKSVTFDEFVDSAILQEQRLAKLMINFNPIVATYVQELKHDSMVETRQRTTIIS